MNDNLPTPHPVPSINSTKYSCRGCGATVIGNETCGDPTRPECADREAAEADAAYAVPMQMVFDVCDVLESHGLHVLASAIGGDGVVAVTDALTGLAAVIPEAQGGRA